MAATLNLSIDKSSPIPLYHQIVTGIEAAIHDGTVSTGSKLDNEIDLAAQLTLSRPTVRKAMDELVRSGLLVRKRGVGTQVVASQVRRPLELSRLYDDLSRSGSKPTTAVLEFSHVPAPDGIRETLLLAPGASVITSSVCVMRPANRSHSWKTGCATTSWRSARLPWPTVGSSTFCAGPV